MAPQVLQLALAFGLMLCLAAVLGRIDRWAFGTPRRRRRRIPRVPLVHRSPPPRPVHRPVQEVAADLRRLSRELAAVPAGAPFVRWRALRAAYDRVLVEACAVLDVPEALAEAPEGTPRDIERLRLVCALEAAGLRVQD